MNKQKINLVNKIKTFFILVSWCLSFSWKASKGYTILQLISQTITPLIAILASFIGKKVLDLMSGSLVIDNSKKSLIVMSVALIGIAIMRVVLYHTYNYSQIMQSDLLQKNISFMMMDCSLKVDLEFLDNPAYYEKQISALRDSYSIPSLFWNVLYSISSLISLIGVSLILARENSFYLLLMLPATIPTAIISAHYTKAVYFLSLEQINTERQLSYYQSVSIDRRYAQDLRLYNITETLVNRYKKLWRDAFLKKKGVIRRKTIETALVTFLPEIVIIVIGFDIASKVLLKKASVGDYALITGLIAQLWGAVSQLTSSVMQVLDNKLRIENLRSYEAIGNKIKDTGKKSLQKIEKITFENVSFSYPNTDHKAIDNVSFTVNPGEKLALVGVNGSGKSTLIKLLLRMYEPDDGVIRINGVDLRDYSILSLRKNFSVFFQDMANFSFTVRENFTLTDETYPNSEERIKRYLKVVGLEDEVLHSQYGLDSYLTKFFNKDGLELSGGQHQKLALARTLYRRNSAVVLDEPSSSLDPKAEHEIFKILEEYTKNRVTIFTSHRLSNVYLADKIIVLEQGQVIEEGTLAQLIKNKKRFAELFQYQKEKFEAPR